MEDINVYQIPSQNKEGVSEAELSGFEEIEPKNERSDEVAPATMEKIEKFQDKHRLQGFGSKALDHMFREAT